ncbi:MAG: hypothetical protein HQ564_10430 [Candidatus Saganbacteria bacterium]|nr:hypothetical protein [Candidatus Saganbacteria bacterium]
MKKKRKTYLDVLESAVKKLWRKYKKPAIIKALHTEVIIEPQPFVQGELNPQISELLIGLYLHKVKTNHIKDGHVEIKDGFLQIIDSRGKLIAETASPKIIREYLS